MEFTLLFAVITAGAAMYVAGRVLRGRLGAVRGPIDSLLAAAAVGLIAGRIAAMLVAGVNPVIHPFEVILVRAGVETSVAAPVAVLALLWLWRGEIPEWIDAVAPVAVVGVAGWHGGCVWRGTCLGTASEVPWAFGLPGSTVTRHPVELYTAVGLILLSVIVARLPAIPWLATGVAVTGVASIRLLTEPLRPSLTGGPTAFYLLAMLAGLLVVAFRHRLPATGHDVGDAGAPVVTDPP